MTINIDSVWVLLGIGITLGTGGYLGIIYTRSAILLSSALGRWLADKVIWPCWIKVRKCCGRVSWKK